MPKILAVPHMIRVVDSLNPMTNDQQEAGLSKVAFNFGGVFSFRGSELLVFDNLRIGRRYKDAEPESDV